MTPSPCAFRNSACVRAGGQPPTIYVHTQWGSNACRYGARPARPHIGETPLPYKLFACMRSRGADGYRAGRLAPGPCAIIHKREFRCAHTRKVDTCAARRLDIGGTPNRHGVLVRPCVRPCAVGARAALTMRAAGDSNLLWEFWT